MSLKSLWFLALNKNIWKNMQKWAVSMWARLLEHEGKCELIPQQTLQLQRRSKPFATWRTSLQQCRQGLMGTQGVRVTMTFFIWGARGKILTHSWCFPSSGSFALCSILSPYLSPEMSFLSLSMFSFLLYLHSSLFSLFIFLWQLIHPSKIFQYKSYNVVTFYISSKWL